MEQKFGIISIDIQVLRDFCRQEGESVCYQKGEQMECEGQPARWFGFVTEGCFKYTVQNISESQRTSALSGMDREHITWFSFGGEFVGDYPTCLRNRPSLTTIEAMVPSHMFRITGEQMMQLFSQNIEAMDLRNIIDEHLLCQTRARYYDFYRATPRKRYELLLRRCPGIVEHLPLNAIASFLNVTPIYLSKIRKEITFGKE